MVMPLHVRHVPIVVYLSSLLSHLFEWTHPWSIGTAGLQFKFTWKPSLLNDFCTHCALQWKKMAVLGKIVWKFLKKLKIELPMIQQSFFWVYIQRKWNHCLRNISTSSCSLQHYDSPRCGNNLIVHWRMNGYRTSDIYIYIYIYIYIVEYYSSIIKEKILPSMTT